MFYYVTTDEQGFITQISKQEQESTDAVKWFMIFVPLEDQSNFVTYFDKYRVDDKGVLQVPQNLPEVTVSTLQKQLTGLLDNTGKIGTEQETNKELISFILGRLAEVTNERVVK